VFNCVVYYVFVLQWHQEINLLYYYGTTTTTLKTDSPYYTVRACSYTVNQYRLT